MIFRRIKLKRHESSGKQYCSQNMRVFQITPECFRCSLAKAPDTFVNRHHETIQRPWRDCQDIWVHGDYSKDEKE